MLEDLLREKQCFKLVCGAGNEDEAEVEKLVAVYAKAGAKYFDLSAREDIVKAAFRGLKKVVSEKEIENFYFNVSVGIKGDPHVSKAQVNSSRCISCGRCMDACLQDAVLNDEKRYSINIMRCIGCGACNRVCPVMSIEMYSKNKPLEEVLPPLIELGIHSIELHAVSDDEKEIIRQWQIINKVFDGMLSLCIDRSRLGDVQLIQRIKSLIENRRDFSTIIQADGAPMSGCDDRSQTTLQAIATAHIVQQANLPVFIMLSGGTNSRTAELASFFSIEAHGVALGSYARMIVKEYLERQDFWENEEVFENALLKAKGLVDKTLMFMGY